MTRNLLLLFLSGFIATTGFRVEILKECCEMGTNYANKNTKCDAFNAPIPGVKKDEEPYCLNSMTACCRNQLKVTDCKAGIQDAKNGNCDYAQPGTERKLCCDACNLGRVTGLSGQPCQSFGLPYEQHFMACCEETKVKPTSSTPTPSTVSTASTKLTPPTKATTVSKNEPLPSIGNLCDIEDLCAQICIPTDDSYKCDCNPGYSLMADGISCKEIKQKPAILRRTNRCEQNNPCDHNCVDTGVAIHCTCREGYQLAKDKRTCLDIDECALNIHTCLENEICTNGEGYYDCELTDDLDFEEDFPDYGKKCPDGFKFNGDKQVCDDIDECTIPLVCDHGQTCINTPGSFECQGSGLVCPPGFYYKDSTQDCEDIDECVTGKNDCNRESQICLNTKGNFTCIDKASKTSCPPGFKMNPATQTCEDINECLENPEICGPNEECINEPGQHSCRPKTPDLWVPSPTPNNFRPLNVTTTTSTTPRTTPKTWPTTLRTTVTSPRTTSSTAPPTTRTSTTTSTTTTTTTTTTTPKPQTSTERVIPSTVPTNTPYPNSYNHITKPTLIFLKPTTVKPIPVFVKPKAPTTCSKGYRYDAVSGQCQDIDECIEDSEACDNYQDCYNIPGSFVCNCKKGFTRDPTTNACIDINECQVGANECLESQRCDNTIGSYVCSRLTGCGTGYTLNYASGLCEDDNECLLGKHFCDKIGPNYVCRNTPGSYRCERVPRFPSVPLSINVTKFNSGSITTCLPGYYKDKYGACRDIDECESNPCPRTMNCENRNGRYECVPKIICKKGFEINESGDQCVDINECVRGTHKCSPSQICKNYNGFFVCLCPPGHNLINNECVDINECVRSRNRICPSNSYCLNTIGSYKCKCKDGFREQENGRCNDIDECRETPGLCHQTCVNLYGGYRCSCERGFLLNSDNRTCTDIDECENFKDRELCIGKCENTPGTYVCRCPPGYKVGSDGRTCQDIDECITQQPCTGKNEFCFNIHGGYKCPTIECPPNYIRDPEHRSRCRRDTQKCHSGNCADMTEQYTYHFFTMVSNMPMNQGPITFFRMKGPKWETSKAKFNLKLERVNCPSHVKRANFDYFRVNRELRKADISFLQPIEGPQEIELSFEMQLFNSDIYSGKVVAKLFIYVSEHRF